MFARESLKTFSCAEKDALYAALNQEDWNWRHLHRDVARQAIRGAKISSPIRVFVLDDSIQVRHGKKMPGVSSHFDHTSGRHVMGQQVLTLGTSSTEGFVPIVASCLSAPRRRKSYINHSVMAAVLLRNVIGLRKARPSLKWLET